MFRFIRTHPYATGGAAVAAIAGLAWLAFGFFGIHTAFIDDVVDDEGPIFASGAVAAETAETVVAPAAPETTVVVEGGATDTTDAPATTAAPETTVPAEPQIITLAEGTFMGSGRYDVEGRAVVLNDGTEQRFLRFEDFNSDNGPDLDVYLSAAPAGSTGSELQEDWILLSELRGNIGDQNYELDPSIDLDRYQTVVIWCTRFSAEFGSAQLG
ncbi:MAG: DM13 domain-containing protein [Actinomycetota bacterium]